MGARVLPIPGKFAGVRSVRIGDCQVDIGAQQVVRQGVATALDPKCFAVLLLLAAEAPNLVTVESLLAYGWAGTIVGENCVQQVIRRLRSAFGDSARSPRIIQTLHRRGYRLLVEAQLESSAVGLPAGMQRELVTPVLVAVLPFCDRSARPTDAYLAEGLTLEIGSQLSKVPLVRVISRDAVADALGSGVAETGVGRALGAARVIEGTVRVEGAQVRVTVQLNDVHSGHQLWSATFDRPLGHLLALHSDIAVAVAQALEVGFDGSGARALLQVGAADSTALRLYHQALSYLPTADADNRVAIGLLNVSLDRDPGFVEARAELAWRYCWDSRSGHTQSRSMAREHASRALAASDLSASAHYAVGAVLLLEHRQGAAILALRRAVELNPSHRRALEDLSFMLNLTGDLDQALELALRAAQVGPGNANTCHHVAIPLLALGEFERLRSLLRRFDAQRPNDRALYRCAATTMVVDALCGLERPALLQARRLLDQAQAGHVLELALAALDVQRLFGPGEAVLAGLEHWQRLAPEARSALGLSPLSVRLRLALALLQTGATGRARELLAQAADTCEAGIGAGHDSVWSLLEMAGVCALRGERSVALNWLDNAYEAGYLHYRVIGAEPSFAVLRDDRRWVRLLASMQHRTARMRASVESRGLLRAVELLA